MSAKKRSFLCKIVHKLTENARFFAQKRHFLHIFAGGRGDFLAGRKWGFFGGGRVRGGARAGHFLCHVFRLRKTPIPSNRVRSQKSYCCTYATFSNDSMRGIRMIISASECSNERTRPKINAGNVAVIRG
jgi:hypothetical protein